jgi:hypothetical protein
MVARYLAHRLLGRDRENSSTSMDSIKTRDLATSSGSELSSTRQCPFKEESRIRSEYREVTLCYRARHM